MKIKKIFKKLQNLFKSLLKSSYTPSVINGAGSINIGTIFLLALGDAFSHIAQIFCLPIAAGTSTIQAALGARKSYLKGKKDRKGLSHATVGILTAIGITISVIFTLIGQSTFATFAPALITATLSAKAIYDLIWAGYYWYKYSKFKNKNAIKAAEYLELAINHSVNFLVTALSAVGLGMVMLAQQPSFGSFGIASGVLGAIYAGYKGYQTYQEHKSEKMTTESADTTTSESTNNTLLHSVFSANAQNNTHEVLASSLSGQTEKETDAIINKIATKTKERLQDANKEAEIPSQQNTYQSLKI